MTQTLERLLCTYFPAAEAAVAALNDAQRAAIDEDALTRLQTAFDRIALEIQNWRSPLIHKHAGIADVKKLSAAQRTATLVTWAVAHFAIRSAGLRIWAGKSKHFEYWLCDALRELSKVKLALSEEHFRVLLECNRRLTNEDSDYVFLDYTLTAVVDAAEANRQVMQLTSEDRAALQEVRRTLMRKVAATDVRQRIVALDQILSDGRGTSLWNGEPWAKAIVDSLEQLDNSQRKAWSAVLAHAAGCNLTKPTKKWLTEAAPLLKAIPPQQRADQLAQWLSAFVRQPRTISHPDGGPGGQVDWQAWAEVQNQVLVNTAHPVGLISLTLVCRDDQFPPLLASLVEAVSKLPAAAREYSVQIGSAAVRVLGAGGTDDDLAQLSRLEMRVRWPKLKKLVKKELDQAIERRGLDRSEVEESLVPDFGLRDGATTIAFTGIKAHITLGRSDKPSLQWQLDDGKTVRSVPKALKAENPDAGNHAKQVVADIEKMRAAQRTRLDLLMRRPRSWPLGLWRQRYLDHGLIGSLARRLIWLIAETPVMFRDGSLVNAKGEPQAFADEATVRLWHPAERPVDEIVAWRATLETWQISQPFKQAHREVYLLTDAERRTRVYSNRFAAHVVRSMTLLSISQVRQWKSGMFGGASSPSFELVDYGLRAEWWMEPAGDEDLPHGAPAYLATDQVRFTCTSEEAARAFGHDGGINQPLPLDQVPPLSLSEIMRDVDLFVGLASVGNDPAWQDGGPDGRFRDYWHSYSFGDLSATGQTRKPVLEKLIPRLKIASRCSFSDKFLIVRGNVRTYKIHLGSGNILMSPNDEYLCIVPDAGAGGTDLYLPFEGDRVLSIILSKAFMLAEDTKITDASIVSQIRR